MTKLDYILMYAEADARAKGLVLPAIQGLSDDLKIVQLARFMANSGQFFLDDANLDNQKRNLSIRAFIEFSIDEIRAHGLQWLDRLREAHGNTSWFKEWESIIDSASDDEIAKIYLSSDQESTRKRISRPTGLLPFDVSLDVKRKGVPI